MIEGNGAVIGLLVTKGFRDILEIRRLVWSIRRSRMAIEDQNQDREK
ncbi:hypothetical protein [Paenibacillus lupini]|nr:hypothetical protein [Paenibacillus lupini]